MKLYILRPSKDSDLWRPWYDKAFAFVIRAGSEMEARDIAAENCGQEGRQAWLSYASSECDELTPDGDIEMIVRDYASA